MQRSTLLTLAAGIAGGLIAGRLVAMSEGVGPSPARDTHSTHEIRTITTPGGGIGRDALRAEIRAALAEAAIAHGATDGSDGSDADAEAPPPRDATPAERTAADTARALFDGAVARGRWHDEDGDRLRAAIDGMTHEDRAALIEDFVSAINSRRIVSDRPIIL